MNTSNTSNITSTCEKTNMAAKLVENLTAKKPSSQALLSRWCCINPLDYGPQKSGPQWRNVFSDWKTNTRRNKKRAAYKKIQRTRRGGLNNTAKPLTDLEQRLLGLFGEIHLEDLEIVEDSSNQHYSTPARKSRTVLLKAT